MSLIDARQWNWPSGIFRYTLPQRRRTSTSAAPIPPNSSTASPARPDTAVELRLEAGSSTRGVSVALAGIARGGKVMAIGVAGCGMIVAVTVGSGWAVPVIVGAGIGVLVGLRVEVLSPIVQRSDS